MAIRNWHLAFFALLAGSLSTISHAQTNNAPRISGTPVTSTAAGAQYSFQPRAWDRDGQALTYSIRNKPSWASFNASTGLLSGKPTSANVGTTSNIVIRVSDGSLRTSLPAFSVTVTGQQNRAPVISGTPATSVGVGAAYSFKPTASDPDGDALTYAIASKPAGATFNVATGQLSWTPAAAGTSSGIVISVTDSRGASVALPAFSINVAATAAVRNATLRWQAPTQYTDGKAMSSSDLTAYRLYQGPNATALSRVAEVDARTVQFTVQNLAVGTHYFAVTAVSTSGVESNLSTVGSKTIR